MRSPLRFLALTFTLALCSVPFQPAEAAPKAATSRASAPKPQSTQRRAKAEASTAARPGRTAKASAPKATIPAPPPVRSDSVGPPNEGRLEGGIRLDLSKPYLRGISTHQARDTRWGLPALVHAIENAAKAVAKKYPGAVLGVGDLSRRGGGELARHHSHESGRDADVGFYLVDARGKPLARPSFVKIDDKLAAEGIPGARFDVAKNWLFLQNLLLDRKARVSHVFVAEPIKHALLAHARSRGVSRAVYVRAAIAMMQPTGGLPHDDHFHVRISCPSSMKKTCVEYAKGAPSKARVAKKGKQRAAMRTPPRRVATTPKPTRAHTPRPQAAATDKPAGIFLSRAAKADADPEVPPSLWALADALSGDSDHPPARDGKAETESDPVDVNEELDDSGAAPITR
ncbi:MAG: penicillin-insensitive murein endopeptidase [Polyangiaceae bacterium]|nr:penicillin-insensitive murein endopeptidase [Polyangiaceae bacterium]